jgi:hypothetical protein
MPPGALARDLYAGRCVALHCVQDCIDVTDSVKRQIAFSLNLLGVLTQSFLNPNYS